MNNDNYNNLTSRRASYVDAIREHAPALGIDITKDHYSRAELRQVSMAWKSKIWIPNWITHDQSRRMGRGMFKSLPLPAHHMVRTEWYGRNGTDGTVPRVWDS